MARSFELSDQVELRDASRYLVGHAGDRVVIARVWKLIWHAHLPPDHGIRSRAIATRLGTRRITERTGAAVGASTLGRHENLVDDLLL